MIWSVVICFGRVKQIGFCRKNGSRYNSNQQAWAVAFCFQFGNISRICTRSVPFACQQTLEEKSKYSEVWRHTATSALPSKAQWTLYVPPRGHYMYRTVVTICTAQWSLYVPHSGHYMYGTVVTTCTAPWSLYVSHSGHYMYRTVVTICTAQWSLYVPPV